MTIEVVIIEEFMMTIKVVIIGEVMMSIEVVIIEEVMMIIEVVIIEEKPDSVIALKFPQTSLKQKGDVCRTKEAFQMIAG